MPSILSRSAVIRSKRRFAQKEALRKRKARLTAARTLTKEKLIQRLKTTAAQKVKTIKGGSVIISFGNKKIFLSLNDGHNLLAQADISVHIHGLQIIASIEQIQGVYGRKKELDALKTANKKAWNILLVNSVIDAAKEAGFTKILLRDITTSRFYRKPNVPYHYVMPPEMVRGVQIEKRAAMERLYKATARELGFKEKEGHYYAKSLA